MINPEVFSITWFDNNPITVTREFNTTFALGIYHIRSGNLAFSEPTSTDNPLFTSGLYNDIDGGPRFFPTSMENDSTMGMWVDALDFKNHVASDDFKNNEVKFPEKKLELQELADSLTEFDNPILILARFK